MRVRMCLFRMHNPAMRAVSAHDAPEEHRPLVARHAIVMPRHVTTDPAPHKSPFSRTTILAQWQGQCHVHGLLTYRKICAEARDFKVTRRSHRSAGDPNLQVKLRF